jgi:hypothetical protein
MQYGPYVVYGIRGLYDKFPSFSYGEFFEE